MRSNDKARLVAMALVLVGSGFAWGCGGTTALGGDAGADGGGSGSGSGGSGSGGSSGGGSGSSSGSGSGSGGGSGSSSGSSSGGATSCPANEPSPGSACPLVGMQCEYGTNPNPSCNALFICNAGGWSTPAPVSCVSGTCPSTFADVPQGKDCTPSGLDCAYPQGQCNCSMSGPVTSQNPVWTCATPMQGCPEPRPLIGSACSTSGLDCDYGACSGGINLACVQGSWQAQDTPCPVFVRH